MATRTLSSLRGDLPFVVAMGSFPSRCESVSMIRSLRLRLRWADRASSLSFSSAGMRSSTDRPSPGALPARPLGSNATANREARMPTATSLRLRPERRTSSERRRLRSAGIRTRTSLREGASTEVLAPYLRSDARAELGAYRPDPLADGETGGHRAAGERPRGPPPRAEDEARRDHAHALGPRADADVPLEAERFGPRARVRDEERSRDGSEGERERDLVAVAVEDERDRAQHEALAHPIGRRIEEGAERRPLAAQSRERAVEDVEDRADDEDERAGQEEEDLVPVLEVDEHRRDRAEQPPRGGQRIRSHARADEARHRPSRERPSLHGVALLERRH